MEDYWNNRLKSHKYFSGVGYLGLGVNYNRWLYQLRRQVFFRQVTALGLDFSRAKILDIGSGNGFYLQLWRLKGAADISAIDISSYAVDNLKENHNYAVIQKLDISKDLTGHNFADKKFDVISTFDVLFHIIDDDGYAKALHNISCLLHRGGYFIFSENFSDENKTGRHLAQRKAEDIIKLLSQNKLRLIKKAPMFVIMNYPVNSKSTFWLASWKLLEKVIALSEFNGWLIGAFLFPIEIFLLNFVKTSYSTYIAICQKE